MDMAGRRFSMGATRLAIAVLLLCVACVFGAQPTLYIPWTGVRGTNGITISSNPAVAIVIFDPRAFTNDAAFSNRVIQLVSANAPTGPWTNSNGTISNSVASTVSNLVFNSSVAANSGVGLASFKNAGLDSYIIGPNGEITSGKSTEQFWNGYASDQNIYLRFNSVEDGDPDNAHYDVEVSNSQAEDIRGNYYYTVRTNSADINLVADATGFDSLILGVFPDSDASPNLNVSIDGTQRIKMHPRAADGQLAFLFGSHYLQTSGDLFQFKNSNVLAVAFDNLGSIAQTNASASNYFGGILRSGISAHIATNTASLTKTTNDLVLNQYYTNFAQRAFVRATVTMTNILATDICQVILYVDQNGDGTFEDTGNEARLQGVALLSGSAQLSTVLDPGARFLFTNFTSGGTSAIKANSSRWFQE